jgi:hypothetical protein
MAGYTRLGGTAVIEDPRVRFAYVATKIGVFAMAAVLTWPLARLIGPEAWIGLAVFGFVLAILTLAVVFGGRRRSAAGLTSPPEAPGICEEPDLDPEHPVEIPVEDSIDLHPFPPRDVPDVVDAYLGEAAARGFTEVRLIHGRGIGLQRDRVQKLLAKHPLVRGFHDAPPERGGWGATIAYLKRES